MVLVENEEIGDRNFLLNDAGRVEDRQSELAVVGPHSFMAKISSKRSVKRLAGTRPRRVQVERTGRNGHCEQVGHLHNLH